MQKKYKCVTEQETTILAEKFADIAKAGDVFALKGTLGVGKSVFARAFIKKKTNEKEKKRKRTNLKLIKKRTEK